MFVPARGRVGYTLRRSVGRGDHTPPEPPMKIGGLREDILFESKEYPLALPKKDCQGGFRISPLTTPLKRPKEGLRPFLWKPSWSHGRFSGDRRGRFAARFTGDVGTGDGSWRLWCLRSFRALCFVGDEADDSLVDVEPALGAFIAPALCVFPVFL